MPATLDSSSFVEGLNSEVKRRDIKVETLRGRMEGYNMVEELHRRVNSTVKKVNSVLHLLRKKYYYLPRVKCVPNGDLDRDGTMFGAWTTVHMTKVGLLQETAIRMLITVLHRLRKFL